MLILVLSCFLLAACCGGAELGLAIVTFVVAPASEPAVRLSTWHRYLSRALSRPRHPGQAR